MDYSRTKFNLISCLAVDPRLLTWVKILIRYFVFLQLAHERENNLPPRPPLFIIADPHDGTAAALTQGMCSYSSQVSNSVVNLNRKISNLTGCPPMERLGLSSSTVIDGNGIFTSAGVCLFRVYRASTS